MSPAQPGPVPRLHLVGRQNHGKTTLLVELLGELCRRGLRPGSIKHSSHLHDLDTPGKDSHRHRLAGASPAAIVTPELTGVFARRLAGDDIYAELVPHFAGCDLILVEGDLDGGSGAPQLEVWRAGPGTPPLALERPGIHAVITDDAEALPPSCGAPRWPRHPIAALADRVLALAGR